MRRVAGDCFSALAGTLGLHLGKYLGGHEQRLANDRHADVAGQVQEDLDQLILGPSLLEGKAEVDIEQRTASPFL
jgi:hypothetical protein